MPDTTRPYERPHIMSDHTLNDYSVGQANKKKKLIRIENQSGGLKFFLDGGNARQGLSFKIFQQSTSAS